MLCQVVIQPPSLQTMARNLHGLLSWHGQKSLRLSQLCPNTHHLNYQRTSLTSLNGTLFSSTVEQVTTNLSIAPDYLCSVKCRGRLTTFHPPKLRWRTIPGDLFIKVDLSGTLPRKVSGRCDFIWLGMEDGWFQVQAKMDNATMKSCRGNCKCYRVNSVCTTLCKTEYGLARVALYSKQCYVNVTLRSSLNYWRQNFLASVFAVFAAKKRGTYTKTARISR